MDVVKVVSGASWTCKTALSLTDRDKIYQHHLLGPKKRTKYLTCVSKRQPKSFSTILESVLREGKVFGWRFWALARVFGARFERSLHTKLAPCMDSLSSVGCPRSDSIL